MTLTPAQIPDEVVEAHAKKHYEEACGFYRIAGVFQKWEDLSDTERANRCAWSRAAILAALNAWEGANYIKDEAEDYIPPLDRLILPLEPRHE